MSAGAKFTRRKFTRGESGMSEAIHDSCRSLAYFNSIIMLISLMIRAGELVT